MRKRRPKARRDLDLMNGPGKLCAALDVDGRLDGEPLDGDRLFITTGEKELDDSQIAVSRRVGVDGAGDAAHWPLRFYLRGDRYVSAYRS